MIKAVLFDMYRTLGEDFGYRNFLDVLLSYGLDVESATRIQSVADTDAFDGTEHDEFSGDGEQYAAWCRSHLHQELQEHGIQATQAHEIAREYEHWKAGFRETLTPYADTHEALRELRTAGYRLAVCSNWDWDVDLVLDDLGVTPLVDDIFASARLGVRKPHSAFFGRILERMELAPAEAVFVGDTWETDIVGATDSGMHAIWIDRRGRSIPEARDGVTHVENLLEVTRVVADLQAGR